MRPIVFLHLPKTAGQSIREYLIEAFPKRAIFPGQIDAHLCEFSKQALSEYSIFSGHFSWASLEFLREPLFFTVLRDPVQRFISYYLYLREQASLMSEDERANDPIQSNILNLKFDELFDGHERLLTAHIKDLFDNFYMYYFATRTYTGNSLLKIPEADFFLKEKLLNVAISNIRESVRVYELDNIELIRADLSQEPGYIDAPIKKLNVGRGGPELYSASDLFKYANIQKRVEELLHLYCMFDRRLFDACR